MKKLLLISLALLVVGCTGQKKSDEDFDPNPGIKMKKEQPRQ